MTTTHAHTLLIDRFKTVPGFRARCSCGVRLRTVRRCNAPGLRYGEAAAREDYDRHVARTREGEYTR